MSLKLVVILGAILAVVLIGILALMAFYRS
jgi:hypothetical protein